MSRPLLVPKRFMMYGDRIRQARKLRRFTQTRLATLVGVKQAQISGFETDTVQPSPTIIEAISAATGFPVRFFERPLGPEVPLGSLAFRARASIKQVDIDEAHAWTVVAYECAYGLAERLHVQPASLPNLSGDTPEKAAKIARSKFGLSPDRPIPNLIYTLEQHSIFVLALPIRLAGRDAWSAWVGINPRYPLIVVPTGSLGGRLRFTVAHELDHLLAPDLRGNSKVIESTANQFASEFLLPASGIANELNVPMTVDNIIPIAKQWGVSPQFVAMRAVQLGNISQRRAQQVFQQLAALGFAQKEPPGAVIRIEKPRLFRRFAELVYGVPINPRVFAKDFDLPDLMASAIINSHAERSELLATVVSGEPDNVIRFPSVIPLT